MSYTNYQESIRIASGDEIGAEPGFYSIVMAAMRRADDNNLPKLQSAFPTQWEELQIRYNAPGGFVSKEEAKALGDGLSDEILEKVPFPTKGWPYGA